LRLCAIAVTLNEAREVMQLAPMQSLGFGERAGGCRTASAHRRILAGGNFNGAPSEHVMQDMWKYGVSGFARGLDLLMRTSVGNILAHPWQGFHAGMLDECSAIASAEGHAPAAVFSSAPRPVTTEGSAMTASMFRDIKAGLPVEADHVIGDLVARGDAAKIPVPKLRTAYTHLKATKTAVLERDDFSSNRIPIYLFV